MNRKFKFTITALALICASPPLYAQSQGDDAFAVAESHYKRGWWDRAVVALDDFATQFPQHPRAVESNFYRAESLVQLRRYADAEKAYGKYLAANPTGDLQAQAIFRLGEMAFFSENYAKAKATLAQILDDHSEHKSREYVLSYLGKISLFEKDYEQAKEYFETALKDYPQGRMADECRLGLGRSLAKLGNDGDAIRFYSYLTSPVSNRFADDAHLELAKLYLGTKKTPKALDILETFSTLFSDSPLSREADFLRATSLARLERFEEAAASFHSVAANETKDSFTPAALFSEAEAYRRLKQPDKALPIYRQLRADYADSDWGDDALQIEIAEAFQRADLAEVRTLTDLFATKYSASPLLAHVQRLKARALIRQDAYEEAAGVLETIVGEATEDDDSRLQASDWYSLARARLGNNDAAGSLKAIDQIDLESAAEAMQAGAHVVRASALMELRRYADAQESLESYLELRPNGADAARCRLQLVLSHAHQDDLEKAIAAHQVVADRHGDDPVFPSITQYLADRCFHAQDYKAAKSLYMSLVEANTTPEFTARGYFGAGWCDLEMKELKAAVGMFAKVIDDYSDSPHAAEAVFAQAKAFESLRDFEAALKAYEHGILKYRETATAEEYLLGVARVRQTLGDHAGAAKGFAQLETAFPQSARLDETLYQQAWSLVDANDPAAADVVFRRLVKNHPTSRYWADSMYRLAQQAALAKQADQARGLLTELLAAPSPVDIRCHALYLQAQLNASENRWKDVITPVETLLREQPEHELAASARYWLAESYYRMGDNDKATVAFDALAEQVDAVPAGWAPMIVLRRAQLLSLRQDWDAALKIAETVSAAYPEFRQQYEVDYLIGRCWASRAEVDFKQARDAFEKVLHSPVGGQTETAAMAQWMIGESYFHQQKYEDALAAYERVDVKFSYPRWQAAALLQQGKCHEKSKDWRQAIRCYTQLLKEHPHSTFAEAARARMETAQQNDRTAARDADRR